MSSIFDRFVGSGDRLVLDDVVFRINDHRPDPGAHCFDLYKGRPLLDQLARFLTRADLRARNVLELGIWDGGSAALWFEVLKPDKLVAVDIKSRGDSDYFKWYVKSRGLEERLLTYWQTDQADGHRLREIVTREFDGPLDLVVDDASHHYEPTKASLEALFPLLRPGAGTSSRTGRGSMGRRSRIPIILANKESLTKFVVELVQAAGTLDSGTIASMTVLGDFVAIERGWMTLDRPDQFALEDQVRRRPWRLRSEGRDSR